MSKSSVHSSHCSGDSLSKSSKTKKKKKVSFQAKLDIDFEEVNSSDEASVKNTLPEIQVAHLDSRRLSSNSKAQIDVIEEEDDDYSLRTSELSQDREQFLQKQAEKRGYDLN